MIDSVIDSPADEAQPSSCATRIEGVAIPLSNTKLAKRQIAVTLFFMAAAILGHGASWVFPGFWIGAWIGQVAVILVAVRHTPRRALGLGLVIGALANGWAFHWAPYALEVCMDAPPWLSHLLFGLLVLWESIAFALFAGMVSVATRRGSVGLWLIAPAWVVTEHWWPKIFPWLLGYSQLDVLPLIQIAELTGSCGIGFVMTAACALPAAWYLYRRDGHSHRAFLGTATYATAATALLIAVVAFGWVQIHRWDKANPHDRHLEVALLQTNVGLMGSEAKLIDMTRAVAQRADLVCWPESAIGTYQTDLLHFRDIARTEEQSRSSVFSLRPTESCCCEILAGGKTFQEGVSFEGPYSMTAFLIDRDENIRGTYHKRTLLPFGEYMPGENFLPGLREWATLRQTIQAGESADPLIASNGAKLGVIICYEDLIRSNVLKTARAGCEVLISLINDGSFKNPLTLEQHKRLAHMRAVEHRRYFLRCAGTGVTCVISPTGKMVAELPKGEDGEIVQQITLYDYATVYTRYGEWFPMACMLACALGLWYSRSQSRVTH